MAEWIQGFSTTREGDVVHHVETIRSKLQHPCSESVCKALKTSWQQLQSGNLLHSKHWAQVALDYAWERLNTGSWKDVSIVWREVYSTAALLKAACLVKDGEMQGALVELDRGILLGAPILDSALHSLAATLTANVQISSLSATADGTTSMTSHTTATGISIRTDMTVKDISLSQGKKKIVFKNYKHFKESDETISPRDSKRPRMEVDVHDLASRTANVPLVDPAHRLPLVYLPSLETFHQRYMLSSTPVVMSGVMDEWPAYSARKWR